MENNSLVLNVDKKLNIEIEGGENCYIISKEGKKILDLTSNNGKNILGYNNTQINNEILRYVYNGCLSFPNLFYNKYQEKLANILCKLAGFYDVENKKLNKKIDYINFYKNNEFLFNDNFGENNNYNINYSDNGFENDNKYEGEEIANIKINGKVYFCNSSNEANEYAIKIVRKRYNILCERKYNEIICFNNCFHGDTIANISSTKNPLFCYGFEPLLNGFKIAEYNNINSVKSLITEHTSAIMIEPIQTQFGIKVAYAKFLKKLRELCDYHKIGLIFDETKTCGFKTGRFFSFEHFDTKPDIITVSDDISNGFPFGACIVSEEFSKFCKNNNFTTNANIFSLTSSVSFIKYGFDNEIYKKTVIIGKILKNAIIDIAINNKGIIKNVIHFGTILHIKIYDYINAKKLAEIILKNGLFCLPLENNYISFCPQIIISEQDIMNAKKIIDISIKQVKILEGY